MLERGRSYGDLQRQAVCRFLQTALIVDDHAVTTENPVQGEGNGNGIGEHREFVDPFAPPPEEALPGDAVASHPQAESTTPEAAEHEEEDQLEITQLNVKLIADRFADHGLTCGVLKPEGEAETVTRIIAAASRADIVVVDWRLGNDRGSAARTAIKEMVERNGYGRRLIAVYTTWRSLGVIASELRSELGLPEFDGHGEELAMDSGGTHIVILNKGRLALAREYQRYQIGEDTLAETLVKRFAERVEGLVPAVALNALAATRENTHRLLTWLGADLDVGYVGHLLRIAHLEDGAQHLLDVVAGELGAIIDDDEETRAMAGQEGVAAWFDDHKSKFSRKVETIEELFEVAVGDGADHSRFREAHPRFNVSEEDYSATLLPKDNADRARLSDAHFAMLMSERRYHARRPPTLHLGTIVREASPEGYYWLCVQPVCDSVRLTATTRFPMLRLERIEHAEKKKGFHIVVAEPPGAHPVHLWSARKPSEIYHIAVTPNAQGSVRFEADPDSGELRVPTAGGCDLIFVAELKAANAQRFAEELGGELTRVGLDESEWLRLRARQAGADPPDSRLPR
jgi:Response receiver domain